MLLKYKSDYFILLLKTLQWLIIALRIESQPPYQGKSVPRCPQILTSALLYVIF